ncbi:MAG: hypothetical protein ACYTHN_21345 [Planctomycetota bacterium]|jgi:hypothetical protein
MKRNALRPILLAAILLLLSAGEGIGRDSRKREAQFEDYCTRLKALVAAYAGRELELHAWCMAQGMEDRAKAALDRAKACDPTLEPKPGDGPRDPHPNAAYAKKVNTLRGATSRDYEALAKWCLDHDLLFESRRCVEKALAWDPRNRAARTLAKRRTLKGTLLDPGRVKKEPGVWKGGRWVPMKEFERTSRKRVQHLCETKKKAFGLPLEGDFLPDVDILYTLPPDKIREVKQLMGKYLKHTRGRYFLSGPKKPFVFFYLKDGAEFKKVGQQPFQGATYEWGKGELYAYPVSMGMDSILHELTHAMQEASFQGFPPLWMNEGLACFFETHGDLDDEEPFGFVNGRDLMYAKTVAGGKARSLERLVDECALSIDYVGYGHGRNLMNYLWQLGELEAFVISAQIYEPLAVYRKPKEIGKAYGRILSALLRKPLAEIGKAVEAFSQTCTKAGTRIPRGQRPDERIDACLGKGPATD